MRFNSRQTPRRPDALSIRNSHPLRAATEATARIAMCASALSNRKNLVQTSVHVAAVGQPEWVNQTALSNPGCKIAGDHSEAHNIPQPCSATSSFNAHCPSVSLSFSFTSDQFALHLVTSLFTSFNKMLCAYLAAL